MRYTVLNARIEEVKRSLTVIHSNAISNPKAIEEVDQEVANKLFEKASGKLSSIVSSVLKTQKLDEAPADYKAPTQGRPTPAVTRAFLASNISIIKNNFEKIVDDLKAKKFVIVDPYNNKQYKLNNTVKGNFTKTLKDIQALVDIYSEKAE